MSNLLRSLGDLDNPSLKDEGQRYAWYEASAVGFQTMILGTLALATAMLWLGPPAVLNWALALVMVGGLAAMLANRHAQALGYRHKGLREFGRPRGLIGLVLIVLFIAGVFFGRAIAGSDQLSTGVGAVVGCGVALLALWVGTRLYARREARESSLDIE